MAILSASPCLRMVTVRAASVDTQQRLPYNRNAPRNPTKSISPKPITLGPPSTTSPAAVLTTGTNTSVADLLKRSVVQEEKDQVEESYLGYERWFPTPPKVEKPRSTFNAASLAYIGDCIYELYARRHFLFPPLDIEEHNDRVTAVVRCEAQDALLQKLNNDNFLSKEERDILRWGKNVGSAKTRSKKRAGVAVYNRASSLETLIGYLYLTDVNRLDEIMRKLGFSSGSSADMMIESAKIGSDVASVISGK